jgi:hypothetical protein
MSEGQQSKGENVKEFLKGALRGVGSFLAQRLLWWIWPD